MGVNRRSSVLQEAGVVDRGRATGPEDGHDDGEPDHALGGGDDHHEEGGDLTVEVAVLAGEGDQHGVRGGEHQSYDHEQHDRVASGEDPDEADREQDRREHDVRRDAHRWSSSVAAGAGPWPVAVWPSRERWTSSMSSASAGADRTVPRAASTRETEASDAVPSGSRAGVSTALCRASTPGVGSGPGWVPGSA